MLKRREEGKRRVEGTCSVVQVIHVYARLDAYLICRGGVVLPHCQVEFRVAARVAFKLRIVVRRAGDVDGVGGWHVDRDTPHVRLLL